MSNKKVTKLTPVENAPSEEVVELLTRLLQAAVAGEITAVAGIAVYRGDQDNETYWRGKSVRLSEILYMLDCFKWRQIQRALNTKDSEG